MPLIQKTVLDSGIKVITEEMPGVESSTIGIWVTSGSRNETPASSGVSHFIEHLLFKGTERRSALDISREIESVGGVLNAFTGREYTCFYVKVLNKDLPLAIDLLSDIFINSRFDKVEMEKEKMVVLQEIKMVEDTPDDIIHDTFAERFWPNHPLGRPILGTSETIKSMERADILEYFNSHYISGNVLITAAGGLRHTKVMRLVGKAFKKVKKIGVKKELGAPKPKSGVKLVKKELEQVHICIGVPVPPQPHPDRYGIYLINTILGGGMSSRLFQEVREKRGLAYSVYTYLSLCKDAGALVAYAGASPESLPEVARLILREFGRCAKGVTKEELDNAREQLKGGMLLGLETSDNRMTKLARDEMFFGKVVPVRELVKGIDGVTLAGLGRLAKRIFAPSGLTVVAMGKVSPKLLPKSLANKVD